MLFLLITSPTSATTIDTLVLYTTLFRSPGITLRFFFIDALATEIYTRPDAFDVVLTTNMFGDILSNQAAALSGGLGLAASVNAGAEHAAANAGHGLAPDITGKGIANPAGIILSTSMLLPWTRPTCRPHI